MDLCLGPVIIITPMHARSVRKHYTKPTHTSHSHTRDFFSRGLRLNAQDLSHRVRFHGVSQNSHSVMFARRFTLRRSTERVFRSYG